MRASRLASGLAGLCALSLSTAPLAAQITLRADLSASNRYVWHGLSRAAGGVLQTSLAAGFQFDRFTISGGLARHLELDKASTGELSELGSGGGHVGEDDAWGQVSLDLGHTRLRSGVVRYVFRGTTPSGSGGALGNTTEVYGAIDLTSRYLNPTFELYWDVDRVRGGFLSASATSPVIGWPLEPFFFIALRGDIGVNLSQQPDPDRPGDGANFERRGITHAGLALLGSSRLHRWEGLGSANLDLGLNLQFNFDDATRYNGVGRNKNVLFWLSLGITVVLGGEARSVR